MSFLPRDSSATEFIRASLEALRQEFPLAYFQMCAQLAPREVLLSIDNELIALACNLDGMQILSQPNSPTVYFNTTRQTIFGLLDSQWTLYEAIMADKVQLRGYTEELTLFYDCLLIYISGALRCPSFPSLLDGFRHSSRPLFHGNHEADPG